MRIINPPIASVAQTLDAAAAPEVSSLAQNIQFFNIFLLATGFFLPPLLFSANSAVRFDFAQKSVLTREAFGSIPVHG
jgi:hypothetical protein